MGEQPQLAIKRYNLISSFSCDFIMVNSVVHAFFVGRAVAQAVGEQLEKKVTHTLGEFGKFDAEQREQLRLFTNRVLELANAAELDTLQNRPVNNRGDGASGSPVTDLQTTIDELRAEIAHVRSELQRYRSRA